MFTKEELIIYFLSIKPLILFVLGITVYAVFIFYFYKLLGKRDIVNLNFGQYLSGRESKLTTFSLNAFKNIILTPIVITIGFVVLSLFFAVLSKNTTTETLLLISVALIGAIRIGSYISEDLSKDLAKMIPFALLAIFLIDINYFSLNDTLSTLKEVPGLLETIIRYLIFVIILETILRILLTLYGLITTERKAPSLFD